MTVPAAKRNRTRRWLRAAGWFLVGLVIALAAAPYLVATVLITPRQGSVGPPPPDLGASAVSFPSQSGATIHGWLIRGKAGAGAIALMHGVNGTRLHMVKRARWLSGQGYTVLLFDFQACGESVGKAVTFGKREADDAQAAISFLQQRAPGERVGVVAVSMGGAASLLADPPLPVHALVLESVYPNITDAIHDRLARFLGQGGANVVTPLLTAQMQPRLGFTPAALRPIDHVPDITTPKLFLAGTLDKHTTIKEAQQLYAASASPKQFWMIDGAAHVNLHEFAPAEYEKRVGRFLKRHLRQ